MAGKATRSIGSTAGPVPASAAQFAALVAQLPPAALRIQYKSAAAALRSVHGNMPTKGISTTLRGQLRNAGQGAHANGKAQYTGITLAAWLAAYNANVAGRKAKAAATAGGKAAATAGKARSGKATAGK